jgi:cell division protein FtsI/penicillin-binding protein 2
VTYNDGLLQRRRLTYLIGGLAVLGGVLFVKLVYLQLIMHSHYLLQATQDQTRKYEIPATRGEIYDLAGTTVTPLVLNQTLQVVWADPTEIKDKTAAVQALAGVLGGDANTYLGQINHAIKYVELATRVPSDQAAKVKALGLSGVGTISRDYRTYPEGTLAAQVLGFVNADGNGQYGLEGYLNKSLAGTAGEFAAKTDTNGNAIATANNIAKQPVDGTSYVLSIDQNIQAEAEKELEAAVKFNQSKDGSVIIMDPNTGQVKAMANYPSYDPGNYQSVKDYNLFQNLTVSDAFEPGSTMKVLTMAAGLNTCVVTPDTTYNDPGSYTVDGYQVSNAVGDKPGPNKSMTIVLQNSLNTGAMYVLRMLSGNPNNFSLAGKQTLYDYFTKYFGLGTLTGIEQAGEVQGTINSPSNNSGNDVNYANMTFGQGMTVTMIQMIDAMASIANGGKLYQPTLIDGTMNADGTETKQAPKLIRTGVISSKVQTQLNLMLEDVVHHGTGYIAYYANPGYAIAGKTGSAQIPNPSGKGYIEGANIGSFLGYAPAINPKFVIMVRIDQPKGAAFAETTTVPLFSSLTQWLFKYDAIAPVAPAA